MLLSSVQIQDMLKWMNLEEKKQKHRKKEYMPLQIYGEIKNRGLIRIL